MPGKWEAGELDQGPQPQLESSMGFMRPCFISQKEIENLTSQWRF